MTDKNNYVRPPKYILKEGDPLIDILKPEFVTVISGDALSAKSKGVLSDSGEDDDDTSGDTTTEGDDVILEAPFLSDLTIVKSEKIRDGNGNDFVRFTINIKNHVGDAVKGAKLYGQ